MPPPRPPPPAKKQGDAEIMIDYPSSSKSPLISPASPDAKGIVRTRAYSPSPSSGSSRSSSPIDKTQGSVRSSKNYNPELNPFADDMDEEEEEGEIMEDKSDTAKLVSGQQTPPPSRPSLNPFFAASVKKKAAPTPPKEVPHQRSVSDIDKGSVIQHQRSGSAVEGQRSGSSHAKAAPQGSASHVGNEGKESVDGSSFDPSVTSGSASEVATSVSEANPVVIVSVCL